MSDFVYLASQSPRRRQLLEQMGVAYELLAPGADEDAECLEAVQPGERPAAYVWRVTALKLEAARQRLKNRGLPVAPILCADTTVALGSVIYGKPSDAADAQRMLGRLSGQTHRVLTAVVLATPQRQAQTLCRSWVTFASMDTRQIQAYVATGEPMGKAGAYAVQGRAGAYITRLHGSYSCVVGLPMYETAVLLRSFGFRV